MSKEMEQYLNPELGIPWDSAAAFLVATKEASIEKDASGGESASEAVEEAKGKGLLSGIRSSVAQDVSHATRVRRTRGSRVGKEMGTLGGAAAGYAVGRKGGIAGKLGGTALGALIGRSAGKSIGEEVDRARTLGRYDRTQKKAEIEKTSVAQVRHLWKLAQGEAPTEAVEGAEGAVPAPGPVDVAGMSQEEMMASGMTPAGPRLVPPSGAPTPEDLEREEAEAQLAEEMMADEAAEQNAVEYYRQMAEDAASQLEEAQQAAQEAQMAADQASQQAMMSQQQADAATQQLQQQSQQDAAEKQQLNEEALSAKQNIMQMRQAMTAYRENLQQLALQDPTAMAGPSPEEQGMAPSDAMAAMGADQDAVEEAQQAEQAQQEAETQAAQAEDTVKKKQLEQVSKQASAVPELLREKTALDWSSRALGAAIGAAGGAGIQALSDRAGPSGMSAKETELRSRLRSLQQKKNPTVFDQHMTTMTRALADTAKINREHPGSAAAMAAITGAVAGATLAPTASKLIRGLR